MNKYGKKLFAPLRTILLWIVSLEQLDILLHLKDQAKWRQLLATNFEMDLYYKIEEAI